LRLHSSYFDSEIVTAVALYYQYGTVCICASVDVDIKLVAAHTRVIQLLTAPATTASMHTVMRSWMSGKNDTSGDRVGRQQRGSSISTHTWQHCVTNTIMMTQTPRWVGCWCWCWCFISSLCFTLAVNYLKFWLDLNQSLLSAISALSA